jgi:anti-sigma regulatory factor (Ser/Thr protein kinase)
MRSREACAELSIPADARHARRAAEWLSSAATALGIPPAQILRLDHCLDEALANVITYGGPAVLACPVDLQLGVRREAGACTAELVIRDAGVAFDPTAGVLATIARPVSLANANPGGLGLRMMREFSDDLTYRRSEDRNHLTIVVSWSETG